MASLLTRGLSVLTVLVLCTAPSPAIHSFGPLPTDPPPAGGGDEGSAQISTSKLSAPVGTSFTVSVHDPGRAGQEINVIIAAASSSGPNTVVVITLDAAGNGSFECAPSVADTYAFDCGNGGMTAVTVY